MSQSVPAGLRGAIVRLERRLDGSLAYPSGGRRDSVHPARNSTRSLNVLAGVPLHQLAATTAPRPPQSTLDHDLPLAPRVPIFIRCFFARYSLASVGPNPRYTSCERIPTIRSRLAALVLRVEGLPAQSVDHRPVASLPKSSQQSFDPPGADAQLLPAWRCVINLFCTFFSTDQAVSLPLGHGECSCFVHLPD